MGKKSDPLRTVQETEPAIFRYEQISLSWPENQDEF